MKKTHSNANVTYDAQDLGGSRFLSNNKKKKTFLTPGNSKQQPSKFNFATSVSRFSLNHSKFSCGQLCSLLQIPLPKRNLLLVSIEILLVSIEILLQIPIQIDFEFIFFKKLKNSN